MTSIIKVDQIQNAAGGVPTAGDLGLDTTGTLINTYSASSVATTQVSSEAFSSVSGLTITLTPSSTSSIFYLYATVGTDTTVADGRLRLAFWRDSTNLASDATAQNAHAYHHSVGGVRELKTVPISAQDAPNTTNQIVYTIKLASGVGQSMTSKVRGDTSKMTFTILEIAG